MLMSDDSKDLLVLDPATGVLTFSLDLPFSVQTLAAVHIDLSSILAGRRPPGIGRGGRRQPRRAQRLRQPRRRARPGSSSSGSASTSPAKVVHQHADAAGTASVQRGAAALRQGDRRQLHALVRRQQERQARRRRGDRGDHASRRTASATSTPTSQAKLNALAGIGASGVTVAKDADAAALHGHVRRHARHAQERRAARSPTRRA